jgi:hypothetical protein
MERQGRREELGVGSRDEQLVGVVLEEGTAGVQGHGLDAPDRCREAGLG